MIVLAYLAIKQKSRYFPSWRRFRIEGSITYVGEHFDALRLPSISLTSALRHLKKLEWPRIEGPVGALIVDVEQDYRAPSYHLVHSKSIIYLIEVLFKLKT